MYKNGNGDYYNRAFSDLADVSDFANPNIVAPFWDDLELTESSFVYYQVVGEKPNRRLIVQWTDIKPLGADALLGTFQAILQEGTNQIQFQYPNLADGELASGSEATIGIMSSNIGFTQYGYNEVKLSAGKAIRFTPKDANNDYALDDTVPLDNVLVIPSEEGPQKPGGLLATPDSYKSLTLSWAASPDANYYKVMLKPRNENSGWDSIRITKGEEDADVPTSIQLTMDDLDYGATYDWKVVAFNELGYTSSEIGQFTTAPGPAWLSRLDLTGAQLHHAFDPKLTELEGVSDLNADSFSISLTPAYPDAQVSIERWNEEDENFETVHTDKPISLVDGFNAFRIVVQLESDDEESYYQEYRLRILKPTLDEEPRLGNLHVSLGTLTPVFHPNQDTYYANLDFSEHDIEIKSVAANVYQTISVTGATYDEQTQSYWARDLPVGRTEVTLNVRSKDQDHNSSYTIYVNRGPVSTDADLSGLTLSQGSLSPSFAVGTHDYTSTVDYDVARLTVTPTAANGYATIAVNGQRVGNSQAGQEIALHVGTNEITIVVTAQDGQTTQTYNVLVNRKNQESQPGGGDTGGGDKPGGGGNGGGSDKTSPKPVSTTDGKLTLAAGAAGDTRLSDEIVVSIPEGATGQELKLTVQKLQDASNLLNHGEVLASPVFELLKNFTENFKKPVTLTFKFDASKIQKGQHAAIFYYDESKQVWVEVGGQVSGSTITAQVDHFTKFAVLATGQASEAGTDEPSYADIAGHWAQEQIKQAVKNGIVKGYTDGTFKPNATITRAEFAVMLANALKLDGEDTSLSSFKDESKIAAWAKTAVARSVKAGIITGYDDKSFRPAANISRAELAVMIARANGSAGTSATETSFADDAKIPAWAKGAVAAVHAAGIVKGREGNKFDPTATATRAEAVVMIMNMLQSKK
ncbi:S-layer homology domain-containing protein [Cohnella nanjingensis]|nr:S-layer homology domain-containing protein [Cohnella nanjingensis]